MKSYKILILLILLSIVSFGANNNDKKNNAVSVWIESVGISSVEPVTFELVIKTRTGIKFGVPEGSVKDFFIKNGINEETGISAPLVYDETNVIYENPKYVSTFTASIPTTLTFVNAEIEIGGRINIIDPNGNQNAIANKKITFDPFPAGPNGDIELKIYEQRNNDDDWSNGTTGIEGSEIKLDGYIFTKGGPESLEADPGIYVIGRTGEGFGQITDLDVKRNNGTIERIPIPFGEKTQFSMKIGEFLKNEKNTVVITPIGILGVSGSETPPLDFVIDTDINSSKLGDGIIGELDSDGKIKVDLSEVKELSGIKGYSYTLKVGYRTKTGGEILDGTSFTTPTIGSVNKIVEITTPEFIGGSKGILTFRVYDKLGHQKTFEKTYFIPTKSIGVKTTVEDEVKSRESKLKIIGEGTKDKFKLENSREVSDE